MNQLDNSNQFNQQATEKPSLCRKCVTFFGNKSQDDMCSKCYKQQMNNENRAAELLNRTTGGMIVEPTLNKAEENSSMIIESKIVSQATEEPKSCKKEQHDHSKCFDCKRKVGALGNKCKCGFTYCKSHRLPEDHECEYNFKQEGAKKLAKENPAIIVSKITKI